MQSNTDNCNQVTFMCKRHWYEAEVRLVDKCRPSTVALPLR